MYNYVDISGHSDQDSSLKHVVLDMWDLSGRSVSQ